MDAFSKNTKDFTPAGAIAGIFTAFLFMAIPALAVRAIWDGEVGMVFWVISSSLLSLIFPVVRFFVFGLLAVFTIGGGLLALAVWLFHLGS